MENVEVYSSTLQHYLRGVINSLPSSQRIQLKTLVSCNTKILVPTHGEGGAFLLSNGESAKVFGLTCCKNMWACPCCTAKRMAQYAEQFAAVLDAMKKKGYYAFMATFTIPHLAFMRCKETTDILFNVWKYFNRSKNHCGGYGNIIRKFFREFDIKHFVASMEYTYGKNGWHPHFHVIYWVKNGRQDEILDWEKNLSEWWLATCKRETLKYWNKNDLYLNVEWREQKLDYLYTHFKDENPVGLYISKKDGKITESTSGQYVAGWGADAELAQLSEKKASTGHYTPHQILQMAYDGDKKMEELYIEFCLQVTQKPFHRRITWSRTGLVAIMKTALQQYRCENLIKKKDIAKWGLLVWFSREQWYTLQDYSKDYKVDIISNLKYIAIHCKEVLLEFLDGLGIGYKLPSEHFFARHIENIFNSEAG